MTEITPFPRTPGGVPAEAVLAHLPAHVVVLDLSGRRVYLDHDAPPRAPEETTIRNIGRFLSPRDRLRLALAFVRARKANAPQSFEAAAVDGRGRRRRVLVTFSPLPGRRGRPRLMIGLAVELSGTAQAGPGAEPAAGARGLTARQTAVLRLIAEGVKNREIARRLGISVRTAEAHRREIGERLDLRGAAALTRFALLAGVL